MERRKRKAASWAACKRVVAGWPKPGVVALVQELYKLSDDNRRFLHTRLLEQLGEYNLEEARRKIEKLVSPSVVYNNAFRHSEIKRVVDQYEKASGDPAGVAGLVVADIESSCETFAVVGDVEEIVDHVYASMNRLHKTLEKLDAAEARPVVGELALVASHWSGRFGYGLSDELEGLAAEWLRRIGMEWPSNDTPADG
jgi:hypothetical protein